MDDGKPVLGPWESGPGIQGWRCVRLVPQRPLGHARLTWSQRIGAGIGERTCAWRPDFDGLSSSERCFTKDPSGDSIEENKALVDAALREAGWRLLDTATDDDVRELLDAAETLR